MMNFMNSGVGTGLDGTAVFIRPRTGSASVISPTSPRLVTTAQH